MYRDEGSQRPLVMGDSLGGVVFFFHFFLFLIDFLCPIDFTCWVDLIEGDTIEKAFALGVDVPVAMGKKLVCVS